MCSRRDSNPYRRCLRGRCINQFCHESIKVETLASNKLIEPPILHCTLLIGKRFSPKCLTFDLSNINFNLCVMIPYNDYVKDVERLELSSSSSICHSFLNA